MGFWNKMKNKDNNDNSFVEGEETVVEDEVEEEDKVGVKDNIFQFSAKTINSTKSTTTVMVVKPVSFDDAQQVADYIKNHKPVLVNFESTNSDVAKRIIDFMGGTAYALSGKLTKVGKNVFMCSPSNVAVEAEESAKFNTNTPANPWEE